MSSKLTSDQIQIINQLSHVDLDVILDSIKAVKDIGNEEFVLPLLNCYLNNPETEVKHAVLALFADLHHTKAMDTYINEVCALPADKIDGPLLSVLWQGKFTLAPKLTALVNVATIESFETVFELNTILENTIEVFTEEAQLESLLIVKKFLQDHPESNVKQLVEESENHLKALTLED